MHPVIHAPSAAIRTLVRLVAGCLLLPLLVGCGSPTVEVVLPADARTATGASAICRGVVAGEVKARSERTLFSRLGDLFVAVCGAIALGSVLYCHRRINSTT